jgi:hypothetical protein
LRNDATALRRDVEAANVRLDELQCGQETANVDEPQRGQAAMREDMSSRFDALLVAIRGTPPA